MISEKECQTLDCSQYWKENYENKIDAKKKDINVIYDKCVVKTINDFVDEFYFSNEIPGVSIYIYDMEYIEELKEKYNNLTFIEVDEDQKKELFDKFGIDHNEKLFVFISDYPSNDTNQAIGDYNYAFYLENGTRLNLSEIHEDFLITVSTPIRNLTLANYDYAVEFSSEGYDIYNTSDDFYTDICSHASTNNNDITLKDRKSDIYPNNITICQDNCEYKDVNLDDQRMVCSCNINADKTNKSEAYIFVEETSEKVIDYILDNINYKIFKCYHLILSLDNLIKNPAFYIIIVIFIVTTTCTFVFLYAGISNIRINMYKELPTKLKLRELVIKHLKEMKKNKNNNNINNNISKEQEPPKKKTEFETIDTNEEIKGQNNIKNTQSTEKISLSINHGSRIDKHLLNKRRNKKDNYFNYKITTEENLTNKINNKENEMDKENKTTIDKNEEIIIYKEKLNLNRIPFTQALRVDKRSFCQLIKSLLFEKIELFNIFFGYELYRNIIISQYLLSLLLGFFFNTFFYSDEIVSHKYHNNGKLDFVVTLILALISNVITSIFVHFIENTKLIEEKLDIIKEVKDETRYLYWLNRYLKSLKKKIIIFIIIELMIILGCFYYIVIFFVVYSQSRKSLLINYLVSLLESLLIAIGISAIIVIMRKIGIEYKNIYMYNTSKFIDINF